MTPEDAIEIQKTFQPLIDQGILPGETTDQKKAKEAERQVLRSHVEACFDRLQAVAHGRG